MEEVGLAVYGCNCLRQIETVAILSCAVGEIKLMGLAGHRVSGSSPLVARGRESPASRIVRDRRRNVTCSFPSELAKRLSDQREDLAVGTLVEAVGNDTVALAVAPGLKRDPQ